MLKRYDIEADGADCIYVNLQHDGRFVEYSDCEKLEAENAKLRQQIEDSGDMAAAAIADYEREATENCNLRKWQEEAVEWLKNLETWTQTACHGCTADSITACMNCKIARDLNKLLQQAEKGK